MVDQASAESGGQRRGADARLASGAVLADRFEVLEIAGSGGMGTVYKARDRVSGAVCALKVLRADGGDQERFQREAEVLSEVRHPHVVGYVAHGRTPEGEPWLAMDWLPGVSLKDVLASRALAPREAAELGEAIASALAAAHAKGIVHRDLKPSNLVVAREGPTAHGLKVLDFGVARLRPSAGDLDRDLTRTGQVIGTPGYMAPEQARGEKDVDERADLFALGCVLYRSIVGKPAFDGADVLAVLTLLVLHDPPRPGELVDGVPDALDALVGKLLEKDRTNRPASAGEVAAELARIAALPERDYGVPARGVRGPPTRRGGDETATSAGRATGDLRSIPASTGLVAAPRADVAPSRRSFVVPLVAALGIGGVAAALILTREGTTQPVVASATTSAPSPSAVEPERRRTDELAKMASTRCAAWGSALARMRDVSGAFGLEAQRDPGGWETGQAVLAWATAARACDFQGDERLPESLAALDRLERPGGWGSSDAHNPTQAFSGGTAWVLLGLVAASALSAAEGKPNAALHQRAAAARAMLLRLQNPNGTFLFKSDSTPGTDEDYSTMIAAWALVESDWLESAVPARASRARAVDALRTYLTSGGGDPPVDTVPGNEEQMAWVILRDRQRGGARPASDEALFEKVARDLIARCADGSTTPGTTTCTIDGATLSPNTHLERDASGREYFRTFWLPWATLLARELSRDDAIGLAPELRARLDGVARWCFEALAATNVTGDTAVYKVAEHLFAASTLGLTDPSITLDPSVRPPGP